MISIQMFFYDVGLNFLMKNYIAVCIQRKRKFIPDYIVLIYIYLYKNLSAVTLWKCTIFFFDKLKALEIIKIEHAKINMLLFCKKNPHTILKISQIGR